MDMKGQQRPLIERISSIQANKLEYTLQIIYNLLNEMLFY